MGGLLDFSLNEWKTATWSNWWTWSTNRCPILFFVNEPRTIKYLEHNIFYLIIPDLLSVFRSTFRFYSGIKDFFKPKMPVFFSFEKLFFVHISFATVLFYCKFMMHSKNPVSPLTTFFFFSRAVVAVNLFNFAIILLFLGPFFWMGKKTNRFYVFLLTFLSCLYPWCLSMFPFHRSISQIEIVYLCC